MKMTEERFWELVRMADWPRRQHEKSEPGKFYMMARLSEAEASAMDDVFDEKRGALAERFDAYLNETEQEAGLGDDSFYDLMGHVVGLGREEYERSLVEPRRLLARAQADDFSEGFSSLIPNSLDYEELDLEQQVKRARENMEGYLKALELPVNEELKQSARRMAHLLRPLAEGEWQLFLAGREEGEALARKVVQDWKPLRGASSSGGDVLHNEWCVLNLYHDVQGWRVDFPAAQQEAAAEAEVHTPPAKKKPVRR